ncbi:uncharacterized protein K452DRAFT_119739 [Aplosporella prunicola CBS 121167]|uniref:Uncharacterized protein n=1 Tax=Aplosporella prunicola CBS 121167 TaxID=1176127 RepID=A0A6A6BP18_9PEZI|nr:uncharacterized protein K452DRAFT_119739 [Aplosporella prunicola CBS 121167]KAF2145428.1 hypothetical protein K452DRAFT_119739 [Aplosporella prunicola CBS 121167]
MANGGNGGGQAHEFASALLLHCLRFSFFPSLSFYSLLRSKACYLGRRRVDGHLLVPAGVTGMAGPAGIAPRFAYLLACLLGPIFLSRRVRACSAYWGG